MTVKDLKNMIMNCPDDMEISFILCYNNSSIDDVWTMLHIYDFEKVDSLYSCVNLTLEKTDARRDLMTLNYLTKDVLDSCENDFY